MHRTSITSLLIQLSFPQIYLIKWISKSLKIKEDLL